MKFIRDMSSNFLTSKFHHRKVHSLTIDFTLDPTMNDNDKVNGFTFSVRETSYISPISIILKVIQEMKWHSSNHRQAIWQCESY